jgi:NAD(P)-dependent dehydrogenase (short-subunit alcohol dehydrogenase family)
MCSLWPGDIVDPATADRIIGGALERFGRVDTLVNNAGVYISKPFTDYTDADYATVVGVNLTGFFWLTQRAIAEMAAWYDGQDRRPGNLSEGSAYANPRRMKGTFTRTYGVKVPFMRTADGGWGPPPQGATSGGP